MTRLLGLLVLSVVLWLGIKVAWGRLSQALGPGGAVAKPAALPLVPCAGCGVYVPSSQARAGVSGSPLCERCRNLEPPPPRA